MEELLRELIQEVKAVRKYLAEAETRIVLVNLAEGELNQGLRKHIHFTRLIMKKMYQQAKEQKKQHVIDAIDNAPYKILPTDDDDDEV